MDREFKVGDQVRLKGGPPGQVAEIEELLPVGYLLLRWPGDPVMNSGAHVRDIELVSDGSEPRQ